MNLKVKVVFKKDRQQFVLRWNDPETGAEHQQKANAKTRADALKEAGQLEASIREGRYDDSGRIVWSHAIERFGQEKLPQLRPRTQEKYSQTLQEIERLVRLRRLADLDASRISIYQAKLRDRGLRPSTIHGRLAHVKAFTRWCEEVGLGKAPRFRMPSLRGVGKLMRGRPISETEFGQVLEAVDSVVAPSAAAAWRFYLRGMWLSGLRRGESLELYWDRQDALWVELDGPRPMLRISAEHEKGGQDRRIPITPDFAKHLATVPFEERTGRVFKLPGRGGKGLAAGDWINRVMRRIGKESGVVVDSRGNRKHVTLHDLRRSFGARWAARVPVHVLRELMRHGDLKTTMDYYVGQDAERTAEYLWGLEG